MMRKWIGISFGFLCCSLALTGQNIGINEDGSTPDASAILDIKANDKGILVPRLTGGQMMAVSSPANGLLIYNTSTDSFWFYNGSWAELNADADSDPGNELQTLSKSGSTISLSGGGGSVNDAVNDADANPTNEIQTLSKSGDMITLSNGGGSILDDDQDDDWIISGPNVYRNTGNVGIGTAPVGYRLQVNGNTFTSGFTRSNIYYPTGSTAYFLDLDNAGYSMATPGHLRAQSYRDISGSSTYYLDPSNSVTSLNTPGDHRGSRWLDISNTNYYLDPASSTSLRAAGSIYGSIYYDIAASSTYFLDLSSSGASLRTPGYHYGRGFYDIQNTSYYLLPSSTGTSLNVAGQIHGSRFVDQACSAYYLDPCDTGVSLRTIGTHHGRSFYDIDNTSYGLDPANTGTALNIAGSAYALNFSAGNNVYTPNFQMPTGAAAGYIMQSDGAGNASWVDPTTVNLGSVVSHEVVHNESVSGVFWTHPTVNVTVEYDNTTQTITVNNDSGQSYWNISIMGNSGAGNSTSCGDLSVVEDVNSGLSLSLTTSLCSGNEQGFTIMAADETGSTTGFRMDVVIFFNRVNAYVAYW